MTPLLLFYALAACSDDTVTDVASCDVVLETLDPASGPSGTAVTLTGSPLTTHYDTALYVGGVRALVSSVDRSTCEDCDICRENEACNACEDCDACDLECRVECIESLTFTVPEAPEGEQPLLIYNVHGSSNTLVFVVEAQVDTGDTSTGDTGSDSGAAGGDSDSGTDSNSR